MKVLFFFSFSKKTNTKVRECHRPEQCRESLCPCRIKRSPNNQDHVTPPQVSGIWLYWQRLLSDSKCSKAVHCNCNYQVVVNHRLACLCDCATCGNVWLWTGRSSRADSTLLQGIGGGSLSVSRPKLISLQQITLYKFDVLKRTRQK